MKREIKDVYDPGSCCPGHDKYPSEKYKNRRSVAKRSEGIKKEHRHARRVKRLALKIDIFYSPQEDF
ncbi:hypothetical protein Maynard_158 [Salmonella phage Maynard]|uniref:Uncharacterized protein n=10 Tax=Kuttervirus TaxID=2169536 RepID=A0A2H5BPQ1_9CAUD|nr:hypothetical protein Maynard_158 [Salmonella phage Maynard]YP_008771777.1 hypothetical protein Marshall_159 [Salmonella phage Marshall]YP_009101438.1 hypothetical protein PI33_gp042 [Escherichia phage ECML-4]YP_009879796.1 hypothetical protein HYP55_gp076 [Salmonella phage Mutine]YP_009880610.1 hypothetical protein HYP66_gp043 [Salmonella phage S118]YP_009883169.1 hypothetical protein HYP88_gp080 [Salmonella phage SS9]YP_009887465.1 hypothetical protein HYQ29_gp128 [Salmonella phage rabaga